MDPGCQICLCDTGTFPVIGNVFAKIYIVVPVFKGWIIRFILDIL